jgi:hypothetical protein
LLEKFGAEKNSERLEKNTGVRKSSRKEVD